LNPKTNESGAFIEDSKAMLALVTMFCIVNQYGDCVRSGWRSVIDCILKLHRLHLLPEKVTDMEEVRNTLKNPNNRMSFNKKAETSILQSVSNLFSFDSGKQKEEVVKTPEEEEAEKRITTYIESCHIEEIFTESKFLEAESLQHLVSALIWSAGETPKGIANSEEEEERALLCLDLLVSTTIRNRDRIELLWDDTFNHLKSIVDSAALLSPLVEKGVFGLLRICQRLVPYKEEVADELLRSLQLILKLDAKVADILAAQLFAELLHLVKASPDRIQTESCWNTFSAILRVGAHHLEASPAGFEILEILVGGSEIGKGNLLSLLEAISAFIEGHAGGEKQSMKALDLLMSVVDKVKTWAASDEVFIGWLKAVNVPKHACNDSRPQVRNQACVMLQQVLLSSYSMGFSADQWGKVMKEVVLATVNALVTNVKKHREHEFPEMDKTARIALLMLSKSFLQFLPSLMKLEYFSEIWLETLSILDLCNSCSSDELSEAVPEVLKNTILVMATQGVLHPGWTDSKGINLWNVTWQRARSTSPNLAPDMLSEYNINYEAK
jgi:brefeldin A-resistance guanine nucleotide exchange factor 1